MVRIQQQHKDKIHNSISQVEIWRGKVDPRVFKMKRPETSTVTLIPKWIKTRK